MNNSINSIKKEIKKDKYWFVRTSDEVLEELDSSKEFGLTELEVQSRIQKYGYNQFESEKNFEWFKILKKNLTSFVIYILFFASLISLFSGDKVEFIIIMIIIFFTVVLGFIQEYKADKSIKALSKLTAKKVDVLRDGVKKTILAQNLVVGDIVYIKRGDIVPADIRIIESFGLTINEAILTGESVSKSKISDILEHQDLSLGDQINMGFSGTNISNGSGIGVVVGCGLDSEIGKISKTLKSIDSGKSPLQIKIDRMSKKISYIVLIVAFFLFLVLMYKGNSMSATLILVGAVIISGIPESFPLALTLALSSGIKRMAKNNAIVKDLNSVETLGTTTVICTDKTGTLTENKMRVTKFYIPFGIEYSAVGKGYEPVNNFLDEKGLNIDKKVLQNYSSLFEGCILCNDSEISFVDNEWKITGEPTEGALITFAKSAGFDDVVLKEKNKRIFDIPFDPALKYMVSVVKSDKNYHAYLKGAGERVLAKCSYVKNSKGEIVHLTDSYKTKIKNILEEYSGEGLRVLFVASKVLDVKGKENISKDYFSKHVEDGFLFEGILGIEDSIREDVFDSIKNCQSAGIRVIMITGDYKTTAIHIGKKLGLLTSHSKVVLEGAQIDSFSDEELDEIIDDVAIISRATPDHKLKVVTSLQRRGEIVAMTGDGVNDAPALKKADIGIAMGLGGTEVAREASNMILTDDNFSTIVKAVREGRTIYSNIRRFVYYLLAGNFTEVLIVVFAVLLNFSLPLTAIMILFINIVTSTIPSLALSIENTHDKVMRQKPRNPKEHLLSGYILSKILILLPVMVIGTLGLYMYYLNFLDSSLAKAMTVAFATLIVFELFHAFNARRLHTTIFDKDFFSNKFIFFYVGISFSLMLFVIYSSLGQSIFGVVPLEIFDWILIFGVSSLVVIISEVIKLAVYFEFNEQRVLQGLKINLE